MASLPFSCDPLAGLDPDQRAAAEIVEGPLVIIAGPGTGKTRTVTHRIAHLIAKHGVAPDHVLAVTFTNRAAHEMRERLQKLMPAAAERIVVTTFHALGHRILREYGQRLGLPDDFRIASEAERCDLLAENLKLSARKAQQSLKRISVLKRAARSDERAAGILPAESIVHNAGETPAARCIVDPMRDREGVAAAHGSTHPLTPSLSPTAGEGARRAGKGEGRGGSDGPAAPNPSTNEDRLLCAAYTRALRECGWVDFDDLIDLPVQLLESHPDVLAYYRNRFRQISVDEFQDIDARQYRLIRLLVPGAGLCVIGDPDQAIYSFRGAEPRFFAQLASDYPGTRTIQLRRNYRSGRRIVQGALQAIAPESLVAGRVLDALSADDTRITIHESSTDKAEAEFVVHTIEKLMGGHAFFSLDSRRVEGGETRSDFSFSDFAVLYRTDAQADGLSRALARSGIPFQRHAHVPLTEREAVQALLVNARKQTEGLGVLDRLRAALGNPKPEFRNPKETRSPKSETTDPAGGSDFGFLSDFVLRVSDLALRCGGDFARFECELALLSDADLWHPRADRVSLLTLHASKGLEFPVVFITGCEDGLLPLRFGADDEAVNLAEERRLFFVGMTRARVRLFLSHAKRRLWRGQLREQAVSPFVATIEQELMERSEARPFKAAERPEGEQLDLFAAG